jgi:OCT family organic cation transporter-like MFS transporter 4/5
MAGGEVSTTQRHHSYASLFKFNSIRIRVIFVGCIWSIISLSYFISTHGQLNDDKSIGFNIALAGVIEILAYFGSMVTSLNFGRIFVIKRLIILSAIIHVLFYFFDPNYAYAGFGKLVVVTLNISVRILMAVGNTFLAIYVIELFPTSIRHYCLGMLGFITKLMYMLSFPFQNFWS